MSKGSDRRPQKITDEQMLANWNKVFGSKQMMVGGPLDGKEITIPTYVHGYDIETKQGKAVYNRGQDNKFYWCSP